MSATPGPRQEARIRARILTLISVSPDGEFIVGAVITRPPSGETRPAVSIGNANPADHYRRRSDRDAPETQVYILLDRGVLKIRLEKYPRSNPEIVFEETITPDNAAAKLYELKCAGYEIMSNDNTEL